jgi:catechol 2,3-dioxygenase-like lactoylglutathione lyase family enzyme
MRRFAGVCIVTRDVQRLRAFYRDVLQVGSQSGSATPMETPSAFAPVPLADKVQAQSEGRARRRLYPGYEGL